MGGPGSGKSHLAGLMRDMGAGVIDADALARASLNEPAVRDQLVAWWGGDVLTAGGGVDRAAVGRRVFDAPEALARLESVVHPRVSAQRRALRTAYQKDSAVLAVVEDCPLLLEQGLDAGCDRLVFVDAPRAVRQQRVERGRGWTTAELDRREKNQAGLDIKRARADYIFDSTADPGTAKSEARRLLDEILATHR